MDSAKRPDVSGSNASLGSGGPLPTGSMPDIPSAAAAGTYFLGRYRVVDEIGIGGMASVHLARMDGPGGFQKWVAVKKIHPHLVEDESFVQMFLDEARVAARISHPNVATVFDLGKHEDTYWIAMEYLHGEPLREVMRRTEELGTAMPPEIACRVIADAAEGLHSAHELLGKHGEKLGLVHRDVTPHNLFVTYEGVTKVVDFGIAKFTTRQAHTRAGTLKGKLAYMSPEQVHGEGIDRRTDIFALGVVLWELTTGQRLFRMESDLDTLAKVQECNVPRPSTLIRGYPVDLEKIVMKALAKNRGERFRTARELSRALQSLLMRRGLFIASDEVAAYTQSIFTERIQKREAHLRWAAEVTQTINVEHMLAKPDIGPEFTTSEVQAAQAAAAARRPGAAASGPPRPAAGMPAGGPFVPAGQAPTNVPRPAAGAPTGVPTRETARPAAARPGPAPPPAVAEEPHPADGEGPTVQAIPERQASFAEAPTLMEQLPPTNEAPTLSAPQAMQNARPLHAPIEDEADDATVVARPAGDGPLRSPPTFPQSPPHQQPVPPHRFGQTNQLAGGPPPPHNPPAGFGPVMPETFGKTLGLGQLSPYAQPQPLHEANADIHTRIAHPSGPQPDYLPRQPAMSGPFTQPPMVRMNAAGYDQRTMTAERFRRRPPMWVVAALSCSIALLLAGIVVAVYAATSGAPPSSSAKADPSTPSAGLGGNAPAGAGPFTSARIAFDSVASSGPTSLPVPTPVPPPEATAAPPPAATTPPAAPPLMGDLPPSPNTATPAASPASPTTTAATRPADPPAATTAKTTPPPPPPAPPPTAPAATAAKPAEPAPAAKPAPTTKPGALGALTIVCMPKCDQIIDNGTPLGAGHIFNRPVPAGRHVLALSAPNGVKKNLQVEVAPDQTREVRIPMDK